MSTVSAQPVAQPARRKREVFNRALINTSKKQAMTHLLPALKRGGACSRCRRAKLVSGLVFRGTLTDSARCSDVTGSSRYAPDAGTLEVRSIAHTETLSLCGSPVVFGMRTGMKQPRRGLSGPADSRGRVR
jgi:hypothetical protein